MSLLDTFVATPFDQIEPIRERLVNSFASHKTYPLEFRKQQLRKLYYAIADNEERIVAALKADLNRPRAETFMNEISIVLRDTLHHLDNLDKWAKDEPVDVELKMKLIKPRLRNEPLGTILVIGAYNFPIMLALQPVIGAISAGNTVVLKPSENAPSVAALMERILGALDPDCCAVVNGGIKETNKLLDLPWDKICYTGGAKVAKIIAEKAAKHLTPVLLELGGFNPALVTKTADAKLAAKRIGWGKMMNAGQICLAPDYVMVHPSKEHEFVEAWKENMKKFYPKGTKEEQEQQCRIVNINHFKRIKNLLDNTKGEILLGGSTDEAKLWIEPTLVKVSSIEDSLLSEEVFGPVLPMLVVDSTPTMIETIKKVGDTPLAIYPFTNDKREEEMILSRTRSGGATINDTIFHAAIPTVPFGGVGQSGTGAYRGKSSFDAFSHKRMVVTQPAWLEKLLAIRYLPYPVDWLSKYKKSQGWPQPNFDRNGKPHYAGRPWTLLFLGANSPKKAIVRYLLAAVMALTLMKNSAKLRLS